jgi:hypothetical protein
MAGKEPSAHADKLSVDSHSARGFIDRQNCCGHLLEQLIGQKRARSYRSLVVSEAGEALGLSLLTMFVI